MESRIKKAKKNGESFEISFEDMLRIARGQVALENKLVARSKRIMFVDTDCFTTTLWSKWFFDGKCDPRIITLAKKNRHDFYVLTAPDVAWVKDDVRYFPNQEEREKFFYEYETMLRDRRARYVIIRGEGDQRERDAIAAVKNFFDAHFMYGYFRRKRR